MSTTRTITILLIGVACIIGLTGLAPSQTKDDPAKTIDPVFPDGFVHDFGKVKQGSRPKHSFRIVNTSDTPLRLLEVRVSMNPLRAYVSNGELKKNEAGQLEIVYDSVRFLGQKHSTVYLLYEENGKLKQARFWLKAESQQLP